MEHVFPSSVCVLMVGGGDCSSPSSLSIYLCCGVVLISRPPHSFSHYLLEEHVFFTNKFIRCAYGKRVRVEGMEE